MIRIHSISLAGRLTLDMHSLNNEGTEGNQLLTRMVHVVDGNGRLNVVNAVSGDMLKHIQAEHFYHTAKSNGLPLCSGCEAFDANRINADDQFFETLGESKDVAEILDAVLSKCAMDDTEGVLITKGKRSAARKSTVEFGWLVGLPEQTRTESYFHVKYDPGRGKGSGDESGANLGQAIFHRPASSGVYAAVAYIELARVGFNDVKRSFSISNAAQAERRRCLLQSLAYTFLKPRGAHRNTQHPHIVNWEGVVAVSTSSVPAPTASALNPDFDVEVHGVAEQLNRIERDAVQVYDFKSQTEFARIMADLLEQV